MKDSLVKIEVIRLASITQIDAHHFGSLLVRVHELLISQPAKHA